MTCQSSKVLSRLTTSYLLTVPKFKIQGKSHGKLHFPKYEKQMVPCIFSTDSKVRTNVSIIDSGSERVKYSELTSLKLHFFLVTEYITLNVYNMEQCNVNCFQRDKSPGEVLCIFLGGGVPPGV